MQAKGTCRVFCRIAIIFLLANIVFSERLPAKRGKDDLRAIHSAGLRKLGHPLVAKQAKPPSTVESSMPESEGPDVVIGHDHYNDNSCGFDNGTFSIQTPNSSFQLDAERKVIFYVRGRYTTGLMMRVSVLHEGKPYHDETYVPQANCTDLVQKRFHFFNKAAKPPNYNGYAVDAPVPSHLKKLTVFVSVGTTNHSSNEHCYDLICALYELHFHFLPKSENVFIMTNSPLSDNDWEKRNLTCLTLDGNPLAENYGFRMRDFKNRTKIIGELNTTKLELVLAAPAVYHCLVLSRAFGKETLVESRLHHMVFDNGVGVDKETTSKKADPKKLESTSTASKVEFVVGLLVSTLVVIVLESHFF